MLIDWFTVMAQVVNFVVLVALLKYFLFDRITEAMEKREKRIASVLEQAEEVKKGAQEEIDRYRQMNEEVEKNRKRILTEVRDDAESLRKALIETARKEINEVKARWHESMERERNSFLQELRRSIGNEALSIARAALTDLANAELQQRIVDVFAEQVRTMPDDTSQRMREVLRSIDGEITVRAAFELSAEERNRVKKLLGDHIGGEVRVRFERSTGSICGIELRFHGHKIGWSIDSYLDSLEKSVSRTLGEPPKPVGPDAARGPITEHA